MSIVLCTTHTILLVSASGFRVHGPGKSQVSQEPYLDAPCIQLHTSPEPVVPPGSTARRRSCSGSRWPSSGGPSRTRRSTWPSADSTAPCSCACAAEEQTRPPRAPPRTRRWSRRWAPRTAAPRRRRACLRSWRRRQLPGLQRTNLRPAGRRMVGLRRQNRRPTGLWTAGPQRTNRQRPARRTGRRRRPAGRGRPRGRRWNRRHRPATRPLPARRRLPRGPGVDSCSETG
jgi:hypothetical protein